jgi:anti-sigma B factor antagonist
MHVEVRQAEDVIIVDLRGQLVAGTGDELLRDVMNELVAESWKKILLNLSEVSRIDSAGIGELVASCRLAERLGTHVKLLHVRGRVRRVLELGRVLPLFEVYDDEEEALSHFAGAETPAN